MSFSILVVEDESGIRSLIKEVLEDEGYIIYEAADGVVGLEQFKIRQPNLVLLDITMPRLDGFAVLQEIRQQNVDVAVLMVSALRSKSVVAQVIANGADGYLHKPFKLQELVAEVQRMSSLARLSYAP
jgi:DNA-binding response OmpR family regulator